MSGSAPLAISMGEPAGVGPDLVLQLYQERKQLNLPPFLVYGNIKFLAQRQRRLRLDIKLAPGKPDNAAHIFAKSLPVFDFAASFSDQPGVPVPQAGKIVIEAIARATGDCLTGACRALVTAPINKAALTNIGFSFPGHTEFLAHLCAGGGEEPIPVMMLANDDLRVVPLTIHVPLARVPELINTQMIVRKARIVAADLTRRFAIKTPKIAICGLNPHAGENGTMGKEEHDIIKPAISLLKREGYDVAGPLPADTLFHLPYWRRYDVVLAMYHDQALIPIKTVAFDSAVNVTLGLPIVRTSPDHGTAFDLAGSSRASTKSMLAAIRMADNMTTPVE
ncbi:4-hydroxythreonine-4-phosphate dehydrogenase [hydrothermal vent metagenome]|uniref:4-hydroxythreonine-4-phosphate dehydrogenase n=1 Tax=hydrothermal vent metagenome TaxID=652676 RepID=A0A3B0U556_9ZZZZ